MDREIEPRFTLNELIDATGVNQRTIRYYVQQGLVPPAAGKGRSAHYTSAHVEALTQIRELRDRNLSIEEIRQRVEAESQPSVSPIAGESWTRIVVHPGVEIHVHANAPDHVHALIDQMQQLARRWLGDNDETLQN